MQRRLTAILSADVAEYSGLMEADEAGTVERLKVNRSRIFDPCVAAQGGRVVKLMGDGALVEFGSVVAAVNCALAIQEATARAEPERAEAKRIRYRIGINLGDVIVEGDDIYGEGVNVAARLQALAPVGGIAVSLTVRDHVAGKASCAFEDLGEHTVKNIERPVRVFAVHPADRNEGEGPKTGTPRRLSICVLPFANMSGDPEQEYFSDGISEDIITDLSKVSALWVTARNTAFTFKGKHVDAPQIARQLKVSHLLEGSVRKAGGRVRITAQLIDGATGGHVWAERYDRDLNDIFALQDEISQAIVAALKLKLLPEEKKAIEQRGTSDPEAYKLYLMARQYSITGNFGSARRSEAIIRLCRRAIEIDPNYARPWALMAGAQIRLRFFFGREGDDGLTAAERALELDGNLAEAHAAKSRVLAQNARLDDALPEMEIALRLDAESYDVNFAAGQLYYQMRRFDDAILHFEKAATTVETDFSAAGMLASCHTAIGDKEGARRAARRALERCEKIVAVEPDNGSAMGFAVGALAVLGEVERAKEWAERAILLDPDNVNLRYNFACTLITDLHDYEAALDTLGPRFETMSIEVLNWVKSDPDLDAIRDHPRFKAMLEAAEARLAHS
ncbi:MAG TPA: adenylate/guanylate cyclase domain-containing protein [Casimicrobiaceae bacterium]|nr:adenylate/guanylate cyclase domain-containing protein [Casimicrobiaceae bacterium]